MSAYVCEPEEFVELALFAVSQNPPYGMRVRPAYLPKTVVLTDEDGNVLQQLADPAEVAGAYVRILRDENIRSVASRYPDEDTLPGTDGTLPLARIPANYRRRVTDPVHILKLCAHYKYQSCESDEWEFSPAWWIIYRIEQAAIRDLPGYDAAPWGYEPTIYAA